MVVTWGVAVLAFWTFSIARYSEQNILETGYVSVLRWKGGKASTSFGPFKIVVLQLLVRNSTILKVLHSEYSTVMKSKNPTVLCVIPLSSEPLITEL